MLSRFRARLTYANVVATLALFVALGGSSYAAVTITGKNVKNSSLTGKDVKNNSLTGADVKNIKSGDVSDGTLLAQDFKTGQLPAGINGKNGTNGHNGATKVTVRTATGNVAVGAGGSGSHESDAGVGCNPGEQATGGGVSASDENFEAVKSSFPANGNGWIARVKNTSPNAVDTFTATVYVVCASP